MLSGGGWWWSDLRCSPLVIHSLFFHGPGTGDVSHEICCVDRSYGLHICVPPKFICGNASPCNVIVLGGGASGRRMNHEGRMLISAISALRKGTSESSLVPFSMWGHTEKMVVCEPGSGARSLTLDFSASRSEREKCLPSVVFFYSSGNWLRQRVTYWCHNRAEMSCRHTGRRIFSFVSWKEEILIFKH